MDEDATLTQLVSAWVNLSKQTDKGAKEAAYCYEELIDKFEPTLPLLNGLATAKIQLKDYDEAHSRLQEALGKSARGGASPRRAASRNRWVPRRASEGTRPRESARDAARAAGHGPRHAHQPLHGLRAHGQGGEGAQPLVAV